jgi:hypothetical protein
MAEGTLERDSYLIAPAESGWTLWLNGRPLACGMDRVQAEQAARVAARMSQLRGRAADILIHDGRDVAAAVLPDLGTRPRH